MQVRVKTLPPEWQHANLARVHPTVMDELGVGPGDLLRVQNPQNHKQALVRLFVRCPTAPLTGYNPGAENSQSGVLPEIEVDKSLLDFLFDSHSESFDAELKAAGPVEGLSQVSFVTPNKLTPVEQTELQQFIQQARWPIYPGGEFAANLSGTTVVLKVTEEIRREAVIEAGTYVVIRGRDDLEHLQLQQEILAQEVELKHLGQEEARLKSHIEELNKQKRHLEVKTKNLAEPNQRLKTENIDLKEQLKQISTQATELEHQLRQLEIEGRQLHENLSPLAAQVPEFDDIDALKVQGDQKRQELEALIKVLTETINGFRTV